MAKPIEIPIKEHEDYCPNLQETLANSNESFKNYDYNWSQVTQVTRSHSRIQFYVKFRFCFLLYRYTKLNQF